MESKISKVINYYLKKKNHEHMKVEDLLFIDVISDGIKLQFRSPGYRKTTISFWLYNKWFEEYNQWQRQQKLERILNI